MMAVGNLNLFLRHYYSLRPGKHRSACRYVKMFVYLLSTYNFVIIAFLYFLYGCDTAFYVANWLMPILGRPSLYFFLFWTTICLLFLTSYSYFFLVSMWTSSKQIPFFCRLQVILTSFFSSLSSANFIHALDEIDLAKIIS